MCRSQQNSRGFTLIAALLLLMLLSALSVGLFMMVNTEQRVGNNNIQNSLAQRTAEGGIEKMTSDIASTFFSIQNPQPSDISGLDTLNPDTNTYVGYTLTPDTKPNPADPAHPLAKTGWNVVQSGEFKGLFAQTWDITLTSVAQTPGGQQAAMSRRVQQVLIPVFQFGGFCNGDCGFFRNPDYDFNGRFHTNGDLYLGAANSSTVTFHDKVEAYGNVIRTVLPNGTDATPTSANDSGVVRIPTQSNGCDPLPNGTLPGCLNMSTSATGRWGSVLGGPGSAYNNGNPSWQNISTSKYAGFLIDGNYNLGQGTGAEFLDLPFVNSTTANTNNLQHEIIQKPDLTEDPASGVGPYRLYNQAQIRVLLVDDPSQLDGGASDPQNVRLANWKNPSSGLDYSCGVPQTGAATSMYFATASTHVPNPSTNPGGAMTADWQVPPFDPATSSLVTLVPNTASTPSGTYNAPLNTNATGAVPPPVVTATIATFPCNTTTANITIHGKTIAPGTCSTDYPYYNEPSLPVKDKSGTSTWNLLDGWLRVEAYENGAWTPVTQEWLGLGFARGTTPPSSGSPNAVNPNAILLLQEPANRDNGTISATSYTGTAGSCPSSNKDRRGNILSYNCNNPKAPELRLDTAVSATNWTYGVSACAGVPSYTKFNWYPINFYDAREGENWDVNNGRTDDSVNGVMNAVEIDVGNLKKWLKGTIGTTGTQISSLAENGYVLYFSDRRGMLTTSGNDAGNYGFEDTINLSGSGVPDGSPEPVPPGKTLSPEDVNEDGTLDTYGAKNLGLGFGYYTSTVSVNAKINSGTLNPYFRIPTSVTVSGVLTSVPARKNWVSGARHVLKLVDGYLGQVPQPGFTVASENPVYIQGDFNSQSGDAAFTGGATSVNEAASSVVADAVTLLSNAWSDQASFNATKKQDSTANDATDTYYRLAIGAGKNMNFQNLSDLPAGSANYGTDGGMGNFLRLLENWCANGGCSPSGARNLYYKGSMVSLFNSTYATGPFKCCDTVYNPPARNFSFDTLFTTPAGLPPATPMFRDVDNLSSRQLFTQRINASN